MQLIQAEFCSLFESHEQLTLFFGDSVVEGTPERLNFLGLLERPYDCSSGNKIAYFLLQLVLDRFDSFPNEFP